MAAISEKDANIALLELSSSKKKKTQDEVALLKREKDRLVQQLKQQVGLQIPGGDVSPELPPPPPPTGTRCELQRVDAHC